MVRPHIDNRKAIFTWAALSELCKWQCNLKEAGEKWEESASLTKKEVGASASNVSSCEECVGKSNPICNLASLWRDFIHQQIPCGEVLMQRLWHVPSFENGVLTSRRPEGDLLAHWMDWVIYSMVPI